MIQLDRLKMKKLYTIVAVILLTAIYVIIFNLSADTAEESSDISTKIAEFIMRIYYRLTSYGSTYENVAIVIPMEQLSPLEAVIRKVAHFTEYFCVGFLSYSIVLMWQWLSVWKGRGLVVLQLVLSGALDEFHQSFVPGRYPSVKDVLIDTAGGIVGMMLVFLLYKRTVNKDKGEQ